MRLGTSISPNPNTLNFLIVSTFSPFKPQKSWHAQIYITFKTAGNMHLRLIHKRKSCCQQISK